MKENIFPKSKLSILALVIAFLHGLSCFVNAAETVSVRIAKDAPRLNILQRELVLVDVAELPPLFAKINSKWSDTVTRHKQDVFDIKNIPLPAAHKEQWSNLSRLLPKMDPIKKLRSINGFFNSIPSRKDAYTYNTEEYWATPEEFLSKRAGDCEDYALSKYFALQYFSWSSEDLWVIFLRDNINKGMHVVLAARYGDKVFILDNLSRPVYLLIPEKQYAKQVNVVAAFNHKGIWLPLTLNSDASK